MACGNLSKHYSIVMKFTGYPPLNEHTSAIDFGPDRSIREWDTCRKWDTTYKIAVVCERDRNFLKCYCYVFLVQ